MGELFLISVFMLCISLLNAKVEHIMPKPQKVTIPKWMFAFVLTDMSGRNALDIVYSPDKQR